MIICENDRKLIDVDSFVSDYESFEIKIDDKHKYLYKRVSFDADSNHFTYMRIYNRLGSTIFNFYIIGKDKATFRDIIKEQYGITKQDDYNIYELSYIKFLDTTVTYSY